MKISTLAVGAASLLAIPTFALATPLHGHFSGYADHSGGVPGSYSVGESYTVRGILDDVQPDPWYGFLADHEYTVVIVTSVIDVFESPPMVLNVEFGPVTVQIYEDDTTPANYASPGTFIDGTLLLSGSISGMMGQRPNFDGFNWDVVGTVNFTSGAGIEGLLCDLPMGMNDFIAYQTPPIYPPTGYEEAYNIDWFCEATTGVDESSWGRMKSLYR